MFASLLTTYEKGIFSTGSKLGPNFLIFLPCFWLLNSGSLVGSTKSEPTQMEMFYFPWLIWVHYLPLTPTKNNWLSWHPQGGAKFTQKANLLSKTMNTKVPWHLHIAIFITCSPMLKNDILLYRYQSWHVLWWFWSKK